jgi:hypothetical protein
MKLKLLSFQPDQSIPPVSPNTGTFSPICLKIPLKKAKLNKMENLKPEHKTHPCYMVVATQMTIVLYIP